MANRENEISAAPRWLDQLDLRGKSITGDAMLAQRKLSEQVVQSGANYLWTIKENHPALLADLERQFTAPRFRLGPAEQEFRTHHTIEKGHGRVEQRTLTASTGLNHYLDWPHLAQVFEITRERYHCRTGRTEQETVYGLTSYRPDQADAARLLELNRSHWGIENGLHYRRDVTLRAGQSGSLAVSDRVLVEPMGYQPPQVQSFRNGGGSCRSQTASAIRFLKSSQSRTARFDYRHRAT